jgi:histidinol-phosphate aminotransferase
MSEPELLVEPNAMVAEMAPYTGAPPDPLIELKLDSNESAAAVPPLDRMGDGDWQPNRYHRTTSLELRLADRLGVDGSRVLVTAGADDALERAMRAVCRPGREVVLTLPTFEVLERYARLAGADTVSLPWWTGDFPVEEVLAKAGPATALVAVISPNNPTGAVASRAALEALATRLPHSLIVLDHAYVEYGEPEDDLTMLALSHPNVVVLRTFSKAWAAAGLRVGYAVGDPRVLRWMRTLGQPYPVAAPSIAMVQRLLDAHPEPPRERLERVRAEREKLVGRLADLGLETLPSRANFVLSRFGDAAFFRRALVSLGVGIRPFPSRPGLEEWLRITVPEDDLSSSRLHRALVTACAPQALLFDLDGVLADVTGSYREVIRRTAADYGVTVSAADIARIKAAGNANNDCVVTLRLIEEAGLEPSLEEVTRHFEEHYQGDGERPGLWREERPLVTREQLQHLAGGRPLGIITGRPRADAERFLRRFELQDAFATVITMEDGPSKPAPAPVLGALERLGVESAWMVGDTPDDLVAARAAGVLPIAITAPGESLTPRESLQTAGAARVLEELSELEEMLP